MREHTFEIPGDSRLKVQVPAGEIEVTAQAGTEAFVRLEPMHDDEESREAVENATIELHEAGGGHELVVRIHEKRLRFWRTPEIRAEIRVPERTNARIHTASADVHVRGVLGNTETHVASGDMQLDQVEGSLEAHSASGDVRVESVAGAAALHSASGDVEIGRADGSLDLHSASGEFTVRDVGAGPIKVQSASGDVRIGVRAGRGVSVDARSVSGRVSSDIPLDDAPGEGDGPVVEIRVNSVSGDVRIERAAVVPTP